MQECAFYYVYIWLKRKNLHFIMFRIIIKRHYNQKGVTTTTTKEDEL